MGTGAVQLSKERWTTLLNSDANDYFLVYAMPLNLFQMLIFFAIDSISSKQYSHSHEKNITFFNGLTILLGLIVRIRTLS